jgi:hypothetical protein
VRFAHAKSSTDEDGREVVNLDRDQEHRQLDHLSSKALDSKRPSSTSPRPSTRRSGNTDLSAALSTCAGCFSAREPVARHWTLTFTKGAGGVNCSA